MSFVCPTAVNSVRNSDYIDNLFYVYMSFPRRGCVLIPNYVKMQGFDSSNPQLKALKWA